MRYCLIAAAIVGFFLAMMIGVVLYAEGKAEELNRRENARNAENEEKVRREQLEMENDEYNYGHDVDHHYLDGEGEL